MYDEYFVPFVFMWLFFHPFGCCFSSLLAILALLCCTLEMVFECFVIVMQ